MRIAVNTRCLKPGLEIPFSLFTAETFKRIVVQHPEHQFYFIFDAEYDPQFVFAPNVTPLVLGTAPRNVLSTRWWYGVKLPALLKKIEADIFVSTDGIFSLSAKLPQVLVIHNLVYLHGASFLRKSHVYMYQHHTQRYINKAAAIATITNFSKKDILNNYKVSPEKITVVGRAAAAYFKPVDWREKEAIKEKYTSGKEYFLYSGVTHPGGNLLNLLKAFSIFKKRQQSNMQLLIVGRVAWQTNEFEEKLATYKYRAEVKLFGNMKNEELAIVTAGAYASVYANKVEGIGHPVLEALQCEVPLITSNSRSMPELAGSAALYANPDIPEEIAEQMKLIYKDENLRSQLIENGREQVKNFDWQKTADAFWEVIMAGAGKAES